MTGAVTPPHCLKTLRSRKIRNMRTAIRSYGGQILLVGISYDREAGKERRKHVCVIEKA